MRVPCVVYVDLFVAGYQGRLQAYFVTLILGGGMKRWCEGDLFHFYSMSNRRYCNTNNHFPSVIPRTPILGKGKEKEGMRDYIGGGVGVMSWGGIDAPADHWNIYLPDESSSSSKAPVRMNK